MNATPTVLMIDDDDEILHAARLRLEAAGYRVLVAADGCTGIARAVEARPRVILLDLRMPGVDGLCVLEHLRKDPRTRAIPVVVVSANVAEWAKTRALELGARHFLEKPYDGARLLQVVATLMPPSSRPARPGGHHLNDAGCGAAC